MKKIIAAVSGIITAFMLSVCAFAGAPDDIVVENANTGGDFMIYVYIAAGVAAVALIIGVIVMITGKKK